MWIRDVDVPSELITSANEGRLVIFVGAGASFAAPSGLPSFEHLVNQVEARLGIGRGRDGQQRASFIEEVLSMGLSNEQADLLADRFMLAGEPLDVRLGRLAHRGGNVHRAVKDILDQPGSRPNDLHRAIVRLAAVHSRPRIVTTNYDRHLSEVAEDCGIELKEYEAPALPIGDEFEGIVYLHGSLKQEPEQLVVTDLDFGRAYVTDSWASRFLERMFAKFDVLFVGYSHNDVVMKYLARALRPGGRRYICTHEQSNRDWEPLGLTPIKYLAERDHTALTGFISRWVELASMSHLEHRARVRELVSEKYGPSYLEDMALVPEDESYLEATLDDSVRCRYFFEYAKGVEWLQWASTRKAFQAIFDAESSGTQMAQALCFWIVENFLVEPSDAYLVTKLLQGNSWPPVTQRVIATGLMCSSDVGAEHLGPLLALLLQKAYAIDSDQWLSLLVRSNWENNLDMALELFQRCTLPSLKSTIGVSSFTGELTASEYELREAWTKLLLPRLPDYLVAITASLDSQLTRLYRWQRIGGSSFDGLSFRRTAIESHEQNTFQDAQEVLVDCARESIEYALQHNQSVADGLVCCWELRDEALFRRLAVHAWRVRADRSADEKLTWLVSRGWLWEWELRHEAFALLADAVGEASEGVLQELLDEVASGPALEPDDESQAYEVFNLLAWLVRSMPDHEGFQTAFSEMASAHPGFGIREHPDLVSFMTIGTVENALPYSAEELHELIQASPADALEALQRFRVDQVALRGPTWDGAMISLRRCIGAYPLDGLKLAKELGASDSDVRQALLQGWATADLDLDMAEGVLTAIQEWDPGENRLTVAQMLANGGSDTNPTPWHTLAAAQAMASRIWPEGDEVTPLIGTSDLLLDAINSTSGYLARFWTKVVQSQWSELGDDWAGLSDDLVAELDRMIDAPGRRGLLAVTYLASQLHFYFAADRDWTQSRLLPLFDWQSDPTKACGAWQGFLSWGRINEGLLRAGMLDKYIQTYSHVGELSLEHTDALSGHLAAIAVNLGTDERDWPESLIAGAPEEVRVAWAKHVAHELEELNPEAAQLLWQSWIQRYWINRAGRIPFALTTAEAAAMATWLFGLSPVLEGAVSALMRTDAGLVEGVRFLGQLEQGEMRYEDVSLWAQVVTHLLRNTREATWDARLHLREVVEQMRSLEPSVSLEALINQAMRLGFVDAGEW